jgi:hypothetical protein
MDHWIEKAPEHRAQREAAKVAWLAEQDRLYRERME